MPRALAVIAAALLLAGCGGEEETSSSLVEPGNPPPVNSLAIDPAGDGLLLTTNRGLYRIADGEATRIDAEVATPDGKSPVGKFLAVAATPDGNLAGSGHPDEKKRVAGFLGLLGSEDGGQSWEVVSRYALADLHVIHPIDGTIYAADAVLPAILVSPDGGKSWEEHSAPHGNVLDFVVDPEDPDYLIASTEDQMFHSTDQGKTWTPVARAGSARLAWPEAGALYRADADGLVYTSDTRGDGWEVVGRIDGEPWKLVAAESGELYAALADGAIVSSSDGGESWKEYFTP